MRYETIYQDIDFIVRKANMPNSTKNFFFFEDEVEEVGEVTGDISTEQAVEICEMMYKMWEFGRDYEVNNSQYKLRLKKILKNRGQYVSG